MLSVCAIALLGTGHEAAAETAELPFREHDLPAYLLEVPASVSDVLIADAAEATLWRLEIRNQKIVGAKRSYMSVGQNGVGKQRAWDRKSPLGVYFVIEALDTSRMHDKYGAAAFTLDYPNDWDRYNNRTGDGIWLHGVDHKMPERPPMDTDGCLALPNGELLELAQRLDLRKTPVIVAQKLQWSNRGQLERRRLEFRAALERWRQSMQEGDLYTYLSLYHKDFRHRGLNKAKWSAYRLQVFAARPLRMVALEDLFLAADPEESELYVSRFTQSLHTHEGVVTTTKRLYWKRSAGGHWQIISEGSG